MLLIRASRYDGWTSVSFKTEKNRQIQRQMHLSLKTLVVKDSRGIEAVKGSDLTVRHGEVVGIAGLTEMDKQNSFKPYLV